MHSHQLKTTVYKVTNGYLSKISPLHDQVEHKAVTHGNLNQLPLKQGCSAIR